MSLSKDITFSFLACRYEKGNWSECNAQSEMTRNDKLKANSDPSCEQNRQITKKCKAKGVKPTKGNIYLQISHNTRITYENKNRNIIIQ